MNDILIYKNNFFTGFQMEKLTVYGMIFPNGQNVIKSVAEVFNTENDQSNCLLGKVESLVKANPEKKDDATPINVHVSK